MPTVPDIHRRGTRDEQATLASPPLTVGTLYFVTDEGVTERWTGSDWESYSGAGTGVTPPPSPPGATPTTWLVSGGQVAWQAAYTFRVSAAEYYIDSLRYGSAEQTVTLGAAHATLDRIDVIALNTLGVAVVIAGTPAATPSEPSVDPAQYLKLGLVFIEHATVAPPDLVNVTIYAENAGTPSEWAWSSSGGSIVVNSTTSPHAGTTTIEGTSVVAGVYAQGTAAAPLDPTAYDHLLLFLRSKAAWNSSRGLLVTLRLNNVLVGASVEIRRSGTYGFDSAITSSYQMVAVPIVAFAVPQGATINQVRVEDFGGAIGFYLDDVSLQAHATTPVGGGLTQDQADARYAPLVHASRHASGGADAVTVTALAGYPGGTTTFLRADGTFAAAGGAGDVVGPAASVASEIALFDGTTGKLLKRATGTGPLKVAAGVATVAAIDLAGSEVTGNLPVTHLAGGSGASATTFWRGDGSWAAAGGGAGVGVIQTASHQLTHTQILGLNATPYTLVAAQGSNTVVVPLRVIYITNPWTAYTQSAVLKVRWQGSATDLAVTTSFITSSPPWLESNYAREVGLVLTAANNKALLLMCDTNITSGGAAGNKMNVIVEYVVMSVAT